MLSKKCNYYFADSTTNLKWKSCTKKPTVFIIYKNELFGHCDDHGFFFLLGKSKDCLILTQEEAIVAEVIHE